MDYEDVWLIKHILGTVALSVLVVFVLCVTVPPAEEIIIELLEGQR